MALIKCPECGKEVSEKAITCQSCGARIGNGHSKKANLIIVILLLSLAVCCSFALIFIFLYKPISNPVSSASSSNSEIQNSDNSEQNISQGYGSYEEIYLEYSSKLENETPKCIESFLANAESNDDGLEGLAELANDEVLHIADISNEGIEKMAEYMLNHGSGKYNEYEEWSGKLMDVYQDYAAKIYDAYTDYYMKNN